MRYHTSDAPSTKVQPKVQPKASFEGVGLRCWPPLGQPKTPAVPPSAHPWPKPKGLQPRVQPMVQPRVQPMVQPIASPVSLIVHQGSACIVEGTLFGKWLILLDLVPKRWVRPMATKVQPKVQHHTVPAKRSAEGRGYIIIRTLFGKSLIPKGKLCEHSGGIV